MPSLKPLLFLALFALPPTRPLCAGLEGDVNAASDFGEVLNPDRRQGFTVRAETWGGTLPTGEVKAIQHHLIKGNDYRFYLGTAVPGAKVSVHVYDAAGNLVSDDAWQKIGESLSFAGTTVRPKRTGSYYLIVKVEQSPQRQAAWSMVYAFK